MLSTPPLNTLTNSFKNFWNWLNYEYQAETYTSRTVIAFNLFEQLSNTPESDYRNNRLMRIIYILLSSICYRTRPFLSDVIYLYIQGISFSTDCFQQTVDLSISLRVYIELLEQELVGIQRDRQLLRRIITSPTPSATSLSNIPLNTPTRKHGCNR